MRHTSLALKQKSNIAFFTTNKPSITCINTQGGDDDYLVKIVVNWPCYVVMLTISTANKFTSNRTSVVSSRWHGNIFRFFLCTFGLLLHENNGSCENVQKPFWEIGFLQHLLHTMITKKKVELYQYYEKNKNFISIDVFAFFF